MRCWKPWGAMQALPRQMAMLLEGLLPRHSINRKAMVDSLERPRIDYKPTATATRFSVRARKAPVNVLWGQSNRRRVCHDWLWIAAFLLSPIAFVDKVNDIFNRRILGVLR